MNGDSLLYRWKSRTSLFLLLSLAGGCGGQTNVAPVSGTVTLGGNPLAGAVVTFQPMSESTDPGKAVGGSVGRTNSAGRYTLRLIEPDSPGAAVCTHRVTITTATADPGDDTKLASGERVPIDWRNGSQTFDVPAGGTNKADFAIPIEPRE